MTWQPRTSLWFNRTFKPIKHDCDHPAERLVFNVRFGEKIITCLKCGRVTARQRVS